MKKETEKQFDTVLGQALLLMEDGAGIEAIAERFPKHAARLRETLALGPAVKEAASGVVPPERLLRSILRVIDVEPVHPTFSFLAASWRMSIPIAVVGAIAALFAILREPSRPAAPALPLADRESASSLPNVAMKSAGEPLAAGSGAVADSETRSVGQTEMFSAPTAPMTASAPAGGSAAGAAPAEDPSDFAAIFNDEDAAFAEGENDATLARSDGSEFDTIGNSYDEATL